MRASLVPFVLYVALLYSSNAQVTRSSTTSAAGWTDNGTTTSTARKVRIGTSVTGITPSFLVTETATTSPRGIVSAQFNNGTEAARVQFVKARGTPASPAIVQANDMLGRVLFTGYDGANYLDMAAIEVSAVGTIASTRVPTELRFYTATDAAPSVLTQRMVIDKAGNVGIGTTSPATKLEVSGTSALLRLNGGTASNPYLEFTQNDVQKAFIQYLDGGGLRFSENGVVGITQNNGNVGIGTTSPGAILDIAKTSTYTARFWDQTATTGNTRVQISLGAADSATTVTLTNAGTIKAAGYQSSDGSVGATVTTCTSFKNGLCVAGT